VLLSIMVNVTILSVAESIRIASSGNMLNKLNGKDMKGRGRGII
jgi:hypothetical protein